MSTVFVSGASGFVGSAIVGQAASHGFNVVASGKRSSYTVPDAVEYRPVDLIQDAIGPDLFGGARDVIHAAGLAHQFGKEARDEKRFDDTNVCATERLFSSAIAAGVKRLILVSSVSVYGPHTAAVCDESHPCNPMSPYARSKLRSEQVAQDLALNGKVQLVILRLATVYGEHDPGNVVRLIRSIHRNRYVQVGDGVNYKSLIHRDDVARACVRVLQSPVSSDSASAVYNVSSKYCTMREIVSTIFTALNKKQSPLRLPSDPLRKATKVATRMKIPLARQAGGYLEKWLAQDAYSSDRFNKTYEFTPEVGLTEGIAREARWYLQSGMTKAVHETRI